MFNHYMNLAVEDWKSATVFVGHVMTDELNSHHYVNESGSAVQPKEKDVEKVETASKEDTLIKSTVEKPAEITMDDSKTMQNVKDIQIEISYAATEKN